MTPELGAFLSCVSFAFLGGGACAFGIYWWRSLEIRRRGLRPGFAEYHAPHDARELAFRVAQTLILVAYLTASTASLFNVAADPNDWRVEIR